MYVTYEVTFSKQEAPFAKPRPRDSQGLQHILLCTLLWALGWMGNLPAPSCSLLDGSYLKTFPVLSLDEFSQGSGCVSSKSWEACIVQQ